MADLKTQKNSEDDNSEIHEIDSNDDNSSGSNNQDVKNSSIVVVSDHSDNENVKDNLGNIVVVSTDDEEDDMYNKDEILRTKQYLMNDKAMKSMSMLRLKDKYTMSKKFPNVWEGHKGMMEHIVRGFPMPNLMPSKETITIEDNDSSSSINEEEFFQDFYNKKSKKKKLQEKVNQAADNSNVTYEKPNRETERVIKMWHKHMDALFKTLTNVEKRLKTRGYQYASTSDVKKHLTRVKGRLRQREVEAERLPVQNWEHFCLEKLNKVRTLNNTVREESKRIIFEEKCKSKKYTKKQMTVVQDSDSSIEEEEFFKEYFGDTKTINNSATPRKSYSLTIEKHSQKDNDNVVNHLLAGNSSSTWKNDAGASNSKDIT